MDDAPNRSRRVFAELLTTREPEDTDEMLLRLADALDAAGYDMLRWQADGPDIRVVFGGSSATLAGTLREYRAAARRLAAGEHQPWRDLILNDADGPHAARSVDPLSGLE